MVKSADPPMRMLSLMLSEKNCMLTSALYRLPRNPTFRAGEISV